MNRSTVIGLDLGASKITAVVGQSSPETEMTLLAMQSLESQGIRKGNVVDIEAAARVIDALFENLENDSGVHITTCRAGFSGIVTSLTNRAIIAVGHNNHEISGDDIRRAVEAARMVAVPPDRSVIHVLPKHYAVDGNEGVIDPRGMIGTRLEIEIVIVTAVTTVLKNIVKTIGESGAKVHEIVLNSLLAAEAVLLPPEKEMGVAIIDIGAETCDIAVYDQGNPVFTSALPIGGEFITRDLAVGLRTTVQEARRIKEELGLLEKVFLVQENQPDKENEEDESENEQIIVEKIESCDELTVEITNVSGKETQWVSPRMVDAIIRARVEEIVDLLDNELKVSGCRSRLPGGIVLTGGTALLKGFKDLCEEYLDMPVRVGYPENIHNVPEAFNSPAYASVLGNLSYGAKSHSPNLGVKQNLTKKKLLSKIIAWFKEFFN